jgi:hypothetical protein
MRAPFCARKRVALSVQVRAVTPGGAVTSGATTAVNAKLPGKVAKSREVTPLRALPA